MERINLAVPDGTRERIQRLGVPGGPADFIRWALENALQEQERYRRGQDLPYEIPSSYSAAMMEGLKRGGDRDA